jgi:peptidoglycan hydrolase CwlO-like protein
MSELVEIVDSLENKISKLLHKLELLDQTNKKLEGELVSLRRECEVTENSVLEWEEKYKSLKLANTMLGSDTNKTEAKLKINTLVRELDYCIAQLAE